MESSDSSSAQFTIFRDCLAQQLISKQNPDTSDASELDDFVDFVAEESWTSLPPSLQSATYQSRETVPQIDDVGFDDMQMILSSFYERLRKHIVTCAVPPVWSSTRTNACEICDGEIPLTYHHLIPKSTHEKVLKRGWHDVSMLNSVAWLCR
ncbi:hypothetical protein AN958_00455 [Leucoagaricus sp. SymC.cos]|nr:hypothetical protein AN958_00455 [Leucoagaricus sp. SymC.cos]